MINLSRRKWQSIQKNTSTKQRSLTMKTIHLEANKIANLASLIIPKAAK
jgi:hypothetical protein